ncbi:MAG TPA: methylated-DNA--[protein]-cysteine S-methyltransferase [Bryobacteraceae bacterium]|nr:methylated-DNA--[protein]-cysteine S-methyltransferase [Bryobacteraceae bacterium]
MTLAFTEIDSPVGRLLLGGGDDYLSLVWFQSGKRPMTPDPAWRQDAAPFRRSIEEFKEYFAGRLQSFTTALRPEGTAFQKRVWEELQRIPYGETISYGQLAERIGNPKASRAVGLANGSNPISIVVPCHRVIGASGKLTGYGGGLTIKEKLLALERRQLTLL